MCDKPVDFLIVTALEEERRAVERHLPEIRLLSPLPNDIYRYHFGVIPTTFSDGTTSMYRITIVTPPRMGNVPASMATQAAIARWHPRFVVLTGIAGGVRENGVNFGDLLIANQVVNYAQQRLNDPLIGRAEIEFRFYSHEVSPQLLLATEYQEAEAWQRAIRIARPGTGWPQVTKGPIGTGEYVVARSEFISEILRHYPQLVGVEMEGAGVASACLSQTTPAAFLMIKAVSDLADALKDRVPRWREYACEVAATYVTNLLRSGPVPPGEAKIRMPVAEATRLDRITFDTAAAIVADLKMRFSQAVIVAELERLWYTVPDSARRARWCYALGCVGGSDAQTFLNSVLADRTVSDLVRNEAVAATQALVGCRNEGPV